MNFCCYDDRVLQFRKMADRKDRYAFVAEWYDAGASLIRRYQLLFYTTDQTVEMFDMKNKRLFLKRSQVDNVKLQDLFLGAAVNVFSRHLNIVEYGDEFTRKTLGSAIEKTLVVIKPDSMGKMGDIVDRIISEGFIICNARMVQLSRDDAATLYAEHEGKEFFERLLSLMVEGPVLTISITGQNAVKRWREILGPTDPVDARRDFPKSIRAQFGTNVTRNSCHGSDSLQSAEQEVELFFGSKKPLGKRTTKFSNCTLGIIKPHAVAAGLTGQIIREITQSGLGLQISALELRCMDKVNAEEFYEVYKGVVNECGGMVAELTLGPCIAMEITGDDAHAKFREFVGPSDPEIARHLRGHTLRAKFGIDKIKNALHCTDLPEDGPLEVQYFFNILK